MQLTAARGDPHPGCKAAAGAGQHWLCVPDRVRPSRRTRRAQTSGEDAEAAGGRQAKGTRLDLRDNPGGLLDQAVAVSSDFVTQGEIVSTHARHDEDTAWLGAKGVDILGGAPMVVLISGGSASASEIVAEASQDYFAVRCL